MRPRRDGQKRAEETISVRSRFAALSVCARVVSLSVHVVELQVADVTLQLVSSARRRLVHTPPKKNQRALRTESRGAAGGAILPGLEKLVAAAILEAATCSFR